MSFAKFARYRVACSLVCVVAAAVVLSARQSGRGGGQSGPTDARAAQVDAIFAAYTAAGSPGCAVSVTRNGAVQFARGYGLADLEHNVAITPDTLFYVASVSKQFTGVSIGLLVQRGVVALTDDVRKWVPELPTGPTITVANLLHHTSGVRDFLGLQALAGFPADEPLSERQFVAMMSRQRGLTFAPGSAHLYSNSGYALLALIVKRASGTSLKEFAASHVFAPLRMSHSRFRDDHAEPIPNRAIGYAPWAGGFRQDVPTFDVVGDGGLFSSANELALWDPTDLPASVGGSELSALMSRPGTLGDGTTVPYAMGLRIDTYRGLPILRHGGAYGGYQTDVTRFPGRRMGVTVLCNLSNAPAWQWGAGGLAQKVADLFFADQFTAPVSAPVAPASSSPPAAARVAFSGPPTFEARMFSDELDTSWALALWSNGARIIKRNQVEIVLTRGERADTYEAPGLSIRLGRDGAGVVSGMVVDAGAITGVTFVRVR